MEGIGEHTDPLGSKNRLMEELKPFGIELACADIDTRDVATRPSYARGEATLDAAMPTMGIVVVASRAASIASSPNTTIKLTRWATSSLINPRSCRRARRCTARPSGSCDSLPNRNLS